MGLVEIESTTSALEVDMMPFHHNPLFKWFSICSCGPFLSLFLSACFFFCSSCVTKTLAHCLGGATQSFCICGTYSTHHTIRYLSQQPHRANLFRYGSNISNCCYISPNSASKRNAYIFPCCILSLS